MINFNNVSITDNICELDFKKFDSCKQIIEIQNQRNYNIDYNNIIIYFLDNKVFDKVYKFKQQSLNVDLTELNENYSLQSWTANKNINYLLIGDSKLEITFNSSELDFDIEDYGQFDGNYNFEKLKDNNFVDKNVSYKKKNVTINKYDALINLDSCILFCSIENRFNVNNYYWNKNIDFYLFDSNLKKYYLVNFKSINKLINALKENFNNVIINDFINQLLNYSYSIIDIIQDKLKKEFVNKLFYEIDVDINKYFEPVMVNSDNTMKAYFSEFYSFGCPNVYVISDGNANKTELSLFKSQSQALINHYTKQSKIDIYTGECIDCNYDIKYRDAQYVIIARKKTTIDVNYIHFYTSKVYDMTVYELVNGIYILLNMDQTLTAINEISQRLKMIDALIKKE